MSMPPLRAQHWLLFALLAGLFFAWGAWLMRGPQAPTPLPWLADWQTRVLQPLVEERLEFVYLPGRCPLGHALGPYEGIGGDVAFLQLSHREGSLLHAIDDDEIIHVCCLV